ncbi:TPA: hypothetical protein DCE37_23555 [Candidatus Latescibacteria bacterium]|nr:hypothetical protein [Candidatus Latescibacterota bacterium]
MQTTRIRIVLLCPLFLIGCLAEDPSSFRTVDSLLTGMWTQVNDPTAPPTIDFNPDRTFSSFSSGVPGAAVRDFSGDFWQAGEVIVFRGTGPVEGVRVQFVHFTIQEDPLVLTMAPILPKFVNETIGVEDINGMSESDVESALRRFDGLPIPETALGYSFDYLK